MLKRIKALFLEQGDAAATGGSHSHSHSHEERHLAAVALLVEAATMDESFDEAERHRIVALAKARFDLSDAEAKELLEAALTEVADSSQLFGFTRVVNARFDYEERVELMEMLWQVAYADGELHDYESNLMRRIAGLIHVTDRDSGNARKRALESLEKGAD